MKKIFAAVLAATTLIMPVAGAFAADDGTPTTQSGSDESSKQKRGEVLEHFKAALEQLDLTTDQKEKIKTIVSDARTKLQALKGESDGKGQAREILQKARQDVMAVLTPEQKQKLKEILQKDRSQKPA